MKIVKGLRGVKPCCMRSIVTIGTFDGIHKGHSRIIKRTVSEAKRRGRHAVVVTFNAHPARITREKETDMGILTCIETKKRILETIGVDVMIIISFNRNFAGISAETFVKKIIYEKLGAEKIIIGEDFHFGNNRKGDVAVLRLLGKKYGFKVSSVPMVKIHNEKVSSTKIRGFIAAGEIEKAGEMLGRKYTVTGKVIKGAQIGKKIGFPTANLSTGKGILLPEGVFEVSVVIENKVFTGMANIGYRPTFNRGKSAAEECAKVNGSKKTNAFKPAFEVHIPDFSGNLYGKTITVAFIRKIRLEKKFTNSFALAEQIKKDIKNCSNVLPIKAAHVLYIGG